MKALRFVLVAAVATLASLVLAIPAGAAGNTGVIPVRPILPLPQCPLDGSIALSKTADKSDYNLNDIVTFTLKVQASVCDATVTVHDLLPAGLTVGDPSVLNHDFGGVAAGAEKSFSFQAVAVAKGQWTNKAHASGYSVGPDDPGEQCRVALNRIIIQPPYHCPRSADAEVTIKVNAPSSSNPSPSPSPTQTPSNSGTPSLPNTGRQG